MNKTFRAAALLLAALLLLPLGACGAGGNATRAAATAGGVSLPYEAVYYLAGNYIADKKEAEPDAAVSDAEVRAFAAEKLASRDTALLALAADYGVGTEKGTVAENTAAYVENMIETDFEGDRKAFLADLRESCLTEHYLRTLIALSEEYLSTAVVMEMIDRGEIDTSDERAAAVFASDDFIRTMQVLIPNGNGKSAQANRATAERLRTNVAEQTDNAARERAMREAMQYSLDVSDLTGSGSYFVRGTMSAEFEAAAFALAEYDVSEVLETESGCCFLMRLPKDEAYITAHFQTLKEQTYFITLNDKVDEKLADIEQSFAWTSYGQSLDLAAPPALSPGDSLGKTGTVAVAVICVVVAAGAVAGVVFLLRRKNKKKA